MKVQCLLGGWAAAVLSGCVTLNDPSWVQYVKAEVEKAKKAFAVGADTLTTNCAKKILDGYEGR